MQTEVTESRRSHLQNNVAVELKGSVFTLPILQIQTTSIVDIEFALKQRLAGALKFFENAPVVIDLQAIMTAEDDIDFYGLMQLMSQQRLIPVGVRNGSSQQNALAVSAGLAILKADIRAIGERNLAKGQIAEVTSAQSSNVGNNSPKNSVSPADVVPSSTKIVTQPIRSGQQIYAKGGDLIIMAPVNHGAEIIADGNIHVYSTMRGRALAGVRGDVKASIFCQSMEAELVAVAGNFRVFEEDLPAEIKSKSVRIYLENEHLVISQL